MTTLPDAPWRSRDGLLALVAVLGGGEVTRLVGGSVRDGLLGLPVSDIDMATQLAPDAVVARVRAAGLKAVPTGIAHGTITVVTTGGPVEVTTLRTDVATDGRHATVAFGTDWRADAARRDFTINALYADAVTGAVVDYFGGLDDLMRRRVAFIGEPLQRIAEDHLRILRFFRFHARFGDGPPDADAIAACTARANDLMALSRERIAAELLKLLAVPDPVPTLATMLDAAILRPVLPELVAVDTLRHLVAREAAAGIAPDGLRRLAALIPADREIARAIVTRLRLSNRDLARIVTAATRARDDVATLAYRHGAASAVDLILLGDGDVRAVDHVRDYVRPVLPISGGMLIARGMPAGPGVAAMLRQIEDDWVAQGFPRGVAFAAIVDRALATR